MKFILTNNKGIALVTSLMLTMITLGIIMALFYILTQSIKISAATKRYRNVTEATYGGGELMAFDIMDNAWRNYSSAGGMTNRLVSTYGNIDLAAVVSNDCLKQKLNSPATNWTGCTAAQKSMDLSTIKTSPDLTFLLKGTSSGQHYKVYAKIVDTSSGNTDVAAGAMVNSNDNDGSVMGGAPGAKRSSDDSGNMFANTGTGLITASGSAYSRQTAGGVAVQHVPFGYRIEVQGEKETNAIEKSNVTVLYAY